MFFLTFDELHVLVVVLHFSLALCQGARSRSPSLDSNASKSGSWEILASPTEEPEDAEESASVAATNNLAGVDSPCVLGADLHMVCADQQSVYMEDCQVRFWGAKQELRTRSAATTAFEADTLLRHPSLTLERKILLRQFGDQAPCQGLLAWASELSHDLDDKYKEPGQCLAMSTPLWTLAKAIHMARLDAQTTDPNHTCQDCHCIPSTSFMLKGCRCDAHKVWYTDILPSVLCKKCTRCLRCYK